MSAPAATRKTPKTSTSAAATAPSTSTSAGEARLRARGLDADPSAQLAPPLDAVVLVAPPSRTPSRPASPRAPRSRATRSRPPAARCCRAQLLDPAPVAEGDERKQRRDRERREREQRVEQELTDSHPREQQRAEAIAPSESEKSVADRVDVAGDARDEVALRASCRGSGARGAAGARTPRLAGRGRSARRRGSAAGRTRRRRRPPRARSRPRARRARRAGPSSEVVELYVAPSPSRRSMTIFSGHGLRELGDGQDDGRDAARRERAPVPGQERREQSGRSHLCAVHEPPGGRGARAPPPVRGRSGARRRARPRCARRAARVPASRAARSSAARILSGSRSSGWITSARPERRRLSARSACSLLGRTRGTITAGRPVRISSETVL